MTRTATLHAAVAHAPTAEAVSFNYGYAPSGIGGIILIIVLILFLTGRLNF